MKHSLLLSTLIALATAPALHAADYKPGHYDVDADHSKLGFEVPHLVISTVEGRFLKFKGTTELAKKFEDSRFTVSAESASVDTGNAKRDEHLRSADFFDTQKFPELKFETLTVKGKPEAFDLTGNLTIRGVTKKVTFSAKYLGAVADGFGNEKAAFTAKTKLNRKDFGLQWGKMMEAGPVVGDEVTLVLRIEAGHPLAKK